MKMKKPNNRTIFNSYLAGLFEGDGRSYLTFERKYPQTPLCSSSSSSSITLV